MLLPHDEFAFAELKSEGKERGHALRRIETAMQRMELLFLAELPSAQRPLIPDGQPVVLEIVVTDTKQLEKEADTSR